MLKMIVGTCFIYVFIINFGLVLFIVLLLFITHNNLDRILDNLNKNENELLFNILGLRLTNMNLLRTPKSTVWVERNTLLEILSPHLQKTIYIVIPKVAEFHCQFVTSEAQNGTTTDTAWACSTSNQCSCSYYKCSVHESRASVDAKTNRNCHSNLMNTISVVNSHSD